MAITQEDVKRGDDEFGAAFNEPEQARPEVSEDEAFGLEIPAEDAAPEGAPADDNGTAPVETGDQPPAEPADAPHGEMPTGEGTVDPESPAEDAAEGGEPAMDPKDIQREKSWEGRLKAREAELAAREAALKSKEIGETETPAQEANEGQAVETIEEVAEQVKSGEITAEQAMQTLTEDFGEDFAKMLDVLITAKTGDVAGKMVDEKVGQVGATIDSVIKDIVDDRSRTHFETIADAHPDFHEMADSQLMKDYLGSLPEDARAKAEQVIEKGSAKAIVKLLNDVKASAKKPEPEQEDPEHQANVEAATGVRSSGLRLPDPPAAAANDYEDAWSKF